MSCASKPVVSESMKTWSSRSLGSHWVRSLQFGNRECGAESAFEIDFYAGFEVGVAWVEAAVGAADLRRIAHRCWEEALAIAAVD